MGVHPYTRSFQAGKAIYDQYQRMVLIGPPKQTTLPTEKAVPGVGVRPTLKDGDAQR